MQTLKRAVIFTLAVFMILAAACSPETADLPGGESGTLPPVTSGADETTPVIADDLPDNISLNKRDFNILCPEWIINEFQATEVTADILNDAIYNRNRAVEERFDVKINAIQKPGTYADRNTFNALIKTAVLTGSTEFDMVAGVASYLPNTLADGIWLDLNKLEYLDFSKPWWGEEMARELAVGDKLYMVTGDVALSMWDSMFVLYYNKKLATDYSVPDFYELVKEKKWTLDKFSDTIKIVSDDIDGNTIYDENDVFGLVTYQNTVCNAYAAAFDMKISHKDNNNIPYAQLEPEKWSTVVTKLVELIRHNNSVLFFPTSVEVNENKMKQVFFEDRALLYPDILSVSRYLREMETDFGIIPFPLYDENQTDYNTPIRNAMSLIGVPATAADPDECGLIIEALAAESYRSVIPQYYEVSLKLKNARDEQSGEMLDIIRDGLWLNFGYVYTISAGGVGNYLRELLRDDNANFTSVHASTWPARETAFKNFVDNIIKLP